MNNSFFSRFAPKEPKFFPMFKEFATYIKEAAKTLEESIDHNSAQERADYHKKVKEIERKGDALANHIADELGSTFITPFDREDIHVLTASLDDVLDGINSSAKRIAIYNPKPLSESAKKLCNVISKSAEVMVLAMDELEGFRKGPAKLSEYCKQLHDLENEGDDIYENFVIKLFEEEKDGIELIKVKEIMHELEKTIDFSERVGKALKSLIVKYA